MSLFNVFNLAGSAIAAQNVRLDLTASNLANADTVAGSPEEVYRAKAPIFQAVYDEAMGSQGVAVRVVGIAEDQTPPDRQYAPGDPLADENGYIYKPNVNAVEEMSNMMSASRAFQINVEMMTTSKELLLRTLSIGQ